MSPLRVRVCSLFAALPLLLCGGCGLREPSATSDDTSAVMETNPELFRELQAELSKIINDATIAYQQLEYDYAEDLLERLDEYEAYFAGGEQGEPPRFIPNLEPEEEVAHIREVIRRWEAQTGKDLRAEVDDLRADVEARTGEEVFHPEFQNKFSQAFDDLIKIEVAEILERRNRVIHREAEALFEEHRDDDPEIIRYFETVLATQYAHPDAAATADRD